MTQRPGGPEPDRAVGGLLLRPPQTLHLLPLAYRWEFTRRHPYYLQGWDLAHRHHAGVLADPLAARYGRLAASILMGIGVSGDPPAPTAGADALGLNQLAAVWQEGAVAPLTYRAAAMQLAELPRESRMAVSAILLNSCHAAEGERGDDFDADRRRTLVMALVAAADPVLDRLPNRPFLGVNLFAPLRAIKQAVGSLVSEWKAAQNIGDRRRRPDMLDDYLRVWDLREGWTGGGYDPAREMSFHAIAANLKIPLATAGNHYDSAFDLLSGHPHTFGNWLRLFGVLKLTGRHGPACLGRRHVGGGSRKAGAVAEVAEATLGGWGEDRDGGLLAGMGWVRPDLDLEMRDTATYICRLVGEGLGGRRHPPKNGTRRPGRDARPNPVLPPSGTGARRIGIPSTSASLLSSLPAFLRTVSAHNLGTDPSEPPA